MNTSKTSIVDGVEIRPFSLRLIFAWEGKQRKETLKLNGVPMLPTKPNLQHATRVVREIKDKIRHGTFVWGDYFSEGTAATTAAPLTFGEQLDNWYAAQRLELSTMASYSSAVRFWKESACGRVTLGEKPLAAVVHSDILKALAARRELAGKTINNYVLVGRQAFELALADGKVKATPFAGLKAAKKQKRPADPFTSEETEKILAYMAKHYPEPILNYTEVKFFTGMRTSESFGLHWVNVDLPSAYIQVSEGIVRGVEKKTTKTNVARNVTLNSRALAAMQRQRKHTQMAGEHVFLDPRYGEPWMEERAYRRSYWTPALKALGIRYRPPYNTRHTYATMMLMAGRTPGWCAKQLGHSIEMFLGTYTKWIDSDQDDREMAALETWLTAQKAAQ